MEKIKIGCDTGHSLLLSELEDFQPEDFKDFSDEAREKLKQSILKNGLFVPLFVWKEKGKLMDGHHRAEVLRDLSAEGYEIPLIPVLYISAKNEKEVAEKILLINSRYAKMSQKGFDSFVEEFDAQDVIEELDIDGIEEIKTVQIEPVDPKSAPKTELTTVRLRVGPLNCWVKAEDAKKFRQAMEATDGDGEKQFAGIIDLIDCGWKFKQADQ